MQMLFANREIVAQILQLSVRLRSTGIAWFNSACACAIKGRSADDRYAR